MGVNSSAKALLLVILLILSVQSAFVASPVDSMSTIPVAEQSPESGLNADLSGVGANPAQVTMFSPSLEHWVSQGSEIVDVVVFTNDLPSLHNWQSAFGLLEHQAGEQAGGRLVESNVEAMAGTVQHRLVSLPGWQVAKLGGVQGTMAVIEPLGVAEPASELETFGEEGNGRPSEGAEPNTFAAVELHGATAAWGRNITGEGVKVAIVDSGIDFAHPDLNGTQARVDDPTSPWDGWPIMFDPRSIHEWIDDGDTYPSDGNSWYSDTSATDLDSDGDGILDSSGLNITGLTSLSGVYHLGEHPDNNLQTRVGGDVDILVLDDIVNGSYTTVLVDLDGDGEFGDETPMRKGSETAGLDLNDDGYWDRSAGLIYFIADGNTSLPYAPTYSARQGMSDRIPGNGVLVAFMLNENGGPAGSHGTLCASSVAAQGLIANAKVQGMAPDAGLISVANYYAGGSGFEAWRFVAEGYDGLTDTGDEAQIGSFSFGYSGVVDAGSDASSMYLDWLTRVYSRNTSYMVALGNGGHGYGTVASPGGAAGIISIGAFSSRTGEASGDTFGQSAAWSNRGPNSQGRMDPDLVTIGWSATGDVTLNEKTDANSAYRTWGGTSLATPVAAGLMALLYQAWFEQYGTFPDSQVIRDLAMSTSTDKAYDPNVQGAGWLDADRATATIAGENGTWWTQPAAWMPGENSGAHRAANINWLLPGGNDTLQLQINNPTSEPLNLNFNASNWQASSHVVYNWTSLESGGDWDGYQSSRPDVVIPILINGDQNNTSISNDTTLVRARATLEGIGFDGNKNYQSENNVYLRAYRWNDTDGDGTWWTDLDGDGLVDSGEWESNNEYSTLTEHMYTSSQVEVRIGDPWDEPADGILLGVFRRNSRSSQEDPLSIQYDITGFRKSNDPWLAAAPAVFVPPSSSLSIPIYFNVPSNATPGLYSTSIEMVDSFGNDWVFPIVATVAASGPAEWTPPELDGNLSNQSLYRETWMQGAQRWGWRAESGDWKAFALEWPPGLSNGSIIVDVDWDDNQFTDIDVHWLSQISHPFYFEAPADYGPWGMAVEVGSLNKHRGSGIWGHHTMTGDSRELLTAEATPGLKQILLHSTTHGVDTSDNPVNVSVGFAATIAGNLSHTVSDWRQTNYTDSLVLGSTVEVEPSSIDGWGWTQPSYWPGETALQDTAETVSTSSYIREISIEDVRRLKVEIDSNGPRDDLDLYLYRDSNGNGAINWGSEQVGLSGNWNSDEQVIIDDPEDGIWWIVVHGYDVPGGNTSFWLRSSVIGGDDINVDTWSELNQSEIISLCPSGCPNLAGEIPKRAWRLNYSIEIPPQAGAWEGYFELEFATGGGLTIPTSFNLLEAPPIIAFNGQNDLFMSNQTMYLSAIVADHQAGFNLSQVALHTTIQQWNDGISIPVDMIETNPAGTAISLNGTQLNITSQLLDFDEQRARNDLTWRIPLEDDSLQHWWPIEKGVGTTADDWRTDQYGPLNAFFINNVSWFSDSQRGDVIGLDGDDSHLQINWGSRPISGETMQIGVGPSTTSFWLNTSVLGDDNFSLAPLLAGADSTGTSDDLRLGWINGSGHIGFTKGSTLSAISTTPVADGNWHHIAITYDPANGWAEVFVDGVMEAQIIGDTGLPVDKIAKIGCITSLAPSNPCLEGQLDDIRMQDVVLSSEQISALFNSTRRDLADLPDMTLRSLNIDMSVPNNAVTQGWYQTSLSAYDLSSRFDSIAINLAYDADIPIYSVVNYQPLTNETTVELAILGEDDLTLEINGILLTPQDDGSAEVGWNGVLPATMGSGRWYNNSFPLDLEGENVFSVMVQDRAGNLRQGNFSIWRDTTPPPLQLNHSITDFIVNQTQIEIRILSEPNADIWVQGLQIPGPITDDWLNVTVNLSQGVNDVVVTARDEAGNWNHAALIFEVDSIAPSLNWTAPGVGELLEHHLVLVEWSLSETSILDLSLNNGDWQSLSGHKGTGQWSVTLDRVGTHNLCIRAEDVGRNVHQECRDFTLSSTPYIPYSTVTWNGTLGNVSALTGSLLLGPDQSWQLYRLMDEEWHQVHTGISPQGGEHTVMYELQEGQNRFMLVAGGLGVNETWLYSTWLDTMDPVLEIQSPQEGVRYPFADGRPFNLWVRGVSEPGLFVECFESAGESSALAAVDANGNFSIAHTRQHPSDVSDGELVDLRCTTVDDAGNHASDRLRMTFDGTPPEGAISFIREEQQLWLEYSLTTTDDLSHWKIDIEYEGGLVQSISGAFNATWPDEIISLGIVKSGTWNATLTAWDSAGNMLQVETGVEVPAETTMLEVLGGVPGGIAGILALVVILLTTLVILDRRKRVARMNEDAKVASLDASAHFASTPSAEALSHAEASLVAQTAKSLSKDEIEKELESGPAVVLTEADTVADVFEKIREK